MCRATHTLFPVFLTEAPAGEGNTFLPLCFLWLLFAKADSQVNALGKRRSFLPRDQTMRGAGAVQALAVPNLGYLWLLSKQMFVCLEIFADSSIPSIDSVGSFLHGISFI